MNNFLNKSKRFTLIAGPCVVESESICHLIAKNMLQVCDEFKINYIFKASFVKANRTKYNSFRGLDEVEALEILKSVNKEFNILTLTDIHEISHIELVSKYVDIIQIPAFLSRQTFLLEAAAKSGKLINIKKGEFMTIETLKYQVEKIKNIDPDAVVILTERGMSFGRHDVVIDFRELPKFKEEPFGCISIVDCSHSVQRVNLVGGISSGNRNETPTLAKAAIAVGVDGLFIETHPDPDNALSDSASTFPLSEMRNLIVNLVNIWDAVHK